MRFNNKETALVLAGLRMLQAHQELYGRSPGSVVEILHDGDALDTNPEEIDKLCEKINYGEAE